MNEPPAGLTVRPATLADAEVIAELIAEVDLADAGTADYGVDELRSDMAKPLITLPTDSWLAFRGGQLVCFGIIWERDHPERIEIDHYVRRGNLVDGEHVLGVILARCAEVAAAQGLSETVVGLGLTPKSAFAQGPLERLGWRNSRRYNVMSKPVSIETDPVPVIPAGLAVRHPDGDADHRLVHALREESFAEHFGHHSTTYDQWVAAGQGEYESSLSWIASICRPDGSRDDIGVLLGRNDRETMGWIRVVGVLKAGRGQGIATLLLRLAFAGFAQAGRDAVGLGVDTENVTGALAVYERAGMTRLYAVDSWTVTVSAD